MRLNHPSALFLILLLCSHPIRILGQPQQTPTNQLFTAIDQENLPALQSALDAGASLTAYSSSGRTPLVAAAAQGNAPIFRALLQAGADPNLADHNHWTPVLQAAFSDQIDVMRILLVHHPDLDAQNSAGWYPLALAANRHDKDLVALLLNAGANINAVSAKTGHSLLTELSLQNGVKDIIEMLRAAGATFANANDELAAAAGVGNLDEIRATLKAGAKVNFSDGVGETALDAAAEKGHAAAVHLLLTSGANPNIMSTSQMTALSWAIFSGNQDTIAELINGGANVNVIVQGKRTLLMEAGASLDDPELIRYLVSKKVDVNAVDVIDETALMAAAETGHKGDVKALLDSGADPTIHDQKGETAADHAHDHHHDDLAGLLAKAEQRGTTHSH